MARDSGRKKKHQNRPAMFAIVFVPVALMIVLGYQTRFMQKKSDAYSEELSRLEKQIA